MVIVGAVLVLIALAAIAAAVTGTAPHARLDLWGAVHTTVSTGTIFIAGMITTVVAVVGVVVLVGGLRRSRRRRKEKKQLAKEKEQLTAGSIDFSSTFPDLNTTLGQNQFGNTGGTGSSGKSKS
jgi:hypothetical protein